MTGAPSEGLRLRRTRDDAIVCRHLRIGTSFTQRFMGLMGRASLPEGHGLYLPDSSIHMFFMRFPIDALFVAREAADGSRRTVGLREHLLPWRGVVLPVPGAAGVFELPAGTVRAFAVRPDDAFVIEPQTESSLG